jgi:serine/threonine protein kinase
MASVRLAHDAELGRPVALKVLHAGLAGDGAFRRRFLREARLAARVSHPNVVQVFDAGAADDGTPYIVMEYVDGESLAELLRRKGRLPPERAVAVTAQAAAGLAHAHAAGLVHRDVKPHNLLVTADGRVKIADFGIARAAQETRLTETGTVLGTAAYAAPEQTAGLDVTAAADVYGLGACLYEALTGRPPYQFDSLAELAGKREEPIPPVRELAPDVSEPLEELVMRCLARKPEYRPTAAEVAAALGASADEDTPAPTLPLPRRRRALRGRWLALAAGVALAALGLGLAAAFAGGGSAPAPAPPRIRAVPAAATPAAQARSIAAWLRRYSR